MTRHAARACVRTEAVPAARRVGILIVGGGPAGCAAAIRLGRAGLRTELIERHRGDHDCVCGGFLGWDALAALKRLGVDAAALGARPIRTLRLVAGRRIIEAPLPQAAAGLSRRTLDAALLRAAAEAGTTVRRGCSARSVDPGERQVRLDDGETIAAESLLLATGKYELRGAARPVAGDAVGLRTCLAGPDTHGASLDGVIELHLFDQGYAGLLTQEDDSLNLCLSVTRQRMKQAGSITALIADIAAMAPALADRMGRAGGSDWSAVAAVPYGWRARDTQRGLFRIGDQAAVIASLAGDGIAMALESGIAAAGSLIAERPDARSFQQDFARRTARSLRIADGLKWAAEHGPARSGLMALLRVAPGLAPLAARLTRIGA